MNNNQKGIRQPLGTMETITNVISGVPPNMALQETRSLKIIYAKKKLQVDIPLIWTVNKVKCMLCTHFDILNFDKFQFQSNKMLIPGKTLVSHLPNDELIVTKADCPKAFEKFYDKTIKKVVKKYNINTQSTMLPILTKDFSHAMSFNVPKGRRKNIEQIAENLNQRRQEEDGVIVMNLLRVIGLAFMANIIFSFASYWQMGVLVLIVGLYYVIDEYVKLNERRRIRAQRQAQRIQQQETKRKQEEKKRNETEQNTDQIKNSNKESSQLKNQGKKFQAQIEVQQPNKEFIQEEQIKRKDSDDYQKANQQGRLIQEEYLYRQKQESQTDKRPERGIFKAKFKLWMAFFAQAIYCYILSIFPNWTVQTHLHANQQAMDQVMDEVKILDPEASEQVKKWEIKEQSPLNQAEVNEDHEQQKQDEPLRQ